MSKTITIDGVEYVPKEAREDERPIIGIVDSHGLTYVGYSNLKRDENGYIPIWEAQCVIKWHSDAHLNYLVNGVCEGVELGAKADILVRDLYQVIELPFQSVEEWKDCKRPRGTKELV